MIRNVLIASAELRAPNCPSILTRSILCSNISCLECKWTHQLLLMNLWQKTFPLSQQNWTWPNSLFQTSNIHIEGLGEEEAKASKEDRRSKSCSGSPNAYLRSKTITAFMRTELHYKERSFHGRDCNFDESLKKWRRAISSPNLHFSDSNVVERDFNLIAEVHMRTNDIMLKVIPPD